MPITMTKGLTTEVGSLFTGSVTDPETGDKELRHVIYLRMPEATVNVVLTPEQLLKLADLVEAEIEKRNYRQ